MVSDKQFTALLEFIKLYFYKQNPLEKFLIFTSGTKKYIDF